MFTGVKTRFPLCSRSSRSRRWPTASCGPIQHDHAQVQMPFMVSTLPSMRLLPVWAFDLVADLFGVNNAMDGFTGRSPAGT